MQTFPGTQIDEVRDLTGGLTLDKAEPATGRTGGLAAGKAINPVDRVIDADQDDDNDLLEDDADLNGFSGMDGLGDDDS
jgi:hypothetical protein